MISLARSQRAYNVSVSPATLQKVYLKHVLLIMAHNYLPIGYYHQRLTINRRIVLNLGPELTSDEEISPIEIEDSLHDTFDFPSKTSQRTPISSQVVFMTSLDLSSQCSNQVPMTPEKSLYTPKSGKRKGYQARKNRNRASMRKDELMTRTFAKLRMKVGSIVSMTMMRVLIFK